MQMLLAHRPVLPGLLLIYAVDPTHTVRASQDGNQREKESN